MKWNMNENTIREWTGQLLEICTLDTFILRCLPLCVHLYTLFFFTLPCQLFGSDLPFWWTNNIMSPPGVTVAFSYPVIGSCGSYVVLLPHFFTQFATLSWSVGHCSHRCCRDFLFLFWSCKYDSSYQLIIEGGEWLKY